MKAKIIIPAAALAAIAALTGCSCASSTVETRPPESITVTPKTQTGQYAMFVTDYKWINEKTGDTVTFNSKGTFSGKIDKKKYSGTFTLRADKKKPGVVYSNVTLNSEKRTRPWVFTFKDSAHMKITTDTGKTESYAAEWTIETKETE